MKLSDALRIAHARPAADAPPFRLALATGFTPLHLGTFLAAYARQALGGRPVELTTGLFGDLPGSLQRMAGEPPDAVAVVVEWSDLDPRLGLRSLGSWAPGALSDLAAEAERRAAMLAGALKAVAKSAPVGVALPTLALPPLEHTRPGVAGPVQSRLLAIVAGLAAELSAVPRLAVVAPYALDQESAPAERHDPKAELDTGFPYRLAHADALGRLLAAALAPPPARKGIITDLDDTLWRGIIGEESAAGVHWDLEHHAQQHGLYQRLLDSLAGAGTLLAVASKNDPATAREGLRRPDIVAGEETFFPIECHWGPKSESVTRILAAWNIAADAAVFVDDSPLELEEVSRAHPGLLCRLFPKNDPAAVWALCRELRELCGRQALSAEDALRAASLRRDAAWREAATSGAGDGEALLAGVEGTVTFCWEKDEADSRPLELLNKTNQFNLNGRRFTEGEWLAWLRRDDTRLLVVSYADKFGPLGKIAVAALRQAPDGELMAERWVMSCRAFSRRVEHHTLEEIFSATGAKRLRMAYRPTERNSPLREFLATLLPVPETEAELSLEAARFAALRPALPHACRRTSLQEAGQ